MGIRTTLSSAARALADRLGKPSFAGTPFPDGGVEKTKQLTQELGGTGTFNFGGFIRGEDFNPQMDAQTSIVNFDEMRRSDSQVHAALEVVKQPIRTADYELDASDPDDAEAIKIAEFVRWNLFDGMTTTWDDVVRQALLMLDFGFMLFEKVWTVADDGPWKDHIVLHKMAPRPPKTLWQWFTDEDGGLLSVKQLAVKAGTYQFLDIPASKLVRFTFQQEGDNFTGISMLRSAYPHWLIKKQLYVIDAIRATRFGVGIPRAKLKAGFHPTTEDQKALSLMLQGLSSHQHAYLIEPAMVDIDILIPQGQQGGAQLLPSIEHQNQQITRNILAQFLDMGGKASGGSRALGASAMDFFLNAIESIADQFCDVMNKQVIKDLVDMNFDGGKYPTLRPVGIQETDIKSMAAAAQSLAAAGLLTPDKKTENTFRNLLNLPEVPDDGDAVTEQQEGAPPPQQPPQQTAPQAPPPPQAAPPKKAPPKPPTVARKAANAQRAEMEDGYAAPRSMPAPPAAPWPEATATYAASAVDDQQRPSDPRFQPAPTPELNTPAEGVRGRGIAQVDENQYAATTHDPRSDEPAATTSAGPRPANTTAQGVTPATSGTGGQGSTTPARTVDGKTQRDAITTAGAGPFKAVSPPNVGQQRQPSGDTSSEGRRVPNTAHMARSTVPSSGDADEEGHSWSEAALPPNRRRSEAASAQATTAIRTPSAAIPAPTTVALADETTSLTFWRDPTPLEMRVLDLREIPRRLDTARSALLVTLRSVREEQISRIASAVAHAKPGERPKAPLVGKMVSDITKVMEDIYRYGRDQVVAELRKQGARIRRTFSDVRDAEIYGESAAFTLALADRKTDPQKLTASAELSAQSASDRLMGSALNEALRLERAGWDPDEIEDALLISMGELSDGDIRGIANREVNEAFSLGRVAAGSDFKDEIEKATYSAILDNNTCEVCEELDDTEFTVDSDEYNENMPPNQNCKGGDNCRCVYIYTLAASFEGNEPLPLAEWDEGQHPRGHGGKFEAGGGGKIADYKSDRPLTGTQSRAIHEVIPSAKAVDYFKTPGVEAMHTAMGVSQGPQAMSASYEIARNTVFGRQPIEDVPYDKLVYTQGRLNLPRAKELVGTPDQLSKPVFMVKSGGKYYVMNGHHRVAGNYLAGNRTMRGHVFTPGVSMADWDESQHPRGHGGKFASGGGGEKGGSSHTAALSRPAAAYKPVNPAGQDTREKFFDGARYTAEREALHSAIEHKLMAGTTPVDKPVSIMLGGGPAGGKSTLVEQVKLGEHNTVRVDVDDIKKNLPEYRDGIASGDKRASSFVHDEASDVSKHMIYTAAASGRNVLLDGTGDNSIENLSNKVATMRAGGQQVEAHYVTCDIKQAIERADARGDKTGRYVPHDYIVSTHQSVARVLPAAIKAGLFDRATVYDTSGHGRAKVIASAVKGTLTVHDKAAWNKFLARGFEKGRHG